MADKLTFLIGLSSNVSSEGDSGDRMNGETSNFIILFWKYFHSYNFRGSSRGNHEMFEVREFGWNL